MDSPRRITQESRQNTLRWRRQTKQKRAFCHFERDRKYVAVRSSFTSRICLFNMAIKSDTWLQEFGGKLLPAFRSKIAAGKNPTWISLEKSNRHEAEIIRKNQNRNTSFHHFEYPIRESRIESLRAIVKLHLTNMLKYYEIVDRWPNMVNFLLSRT